MDYITTAGACLFLVTFIGLPIWAVITGIREDKRKLAEHLAKRDKFLQEEDAKPRCNVTFMTNDGEIHRTNSLEPEAVDYFMNGYILVASESAASSMLGRFYKLGRFIDSRGMTYPTCNVLKAWVEEDK